MSPKQHGFKSAAANQIEEDAENKCGGTAIAVLFRKSFTGLLYLLRCPVVTARLRVNTAVSGAAWHSEEPLLNQKTHWPRVANALPLLLPVENTAANPPPPSPLHLIKLRRWGRGWSQEWGAGYRAETRCTTSSTGYKNNTQGFYAVLVSPKSNLSGRHLGAQLHDCFSSQSVWLKDSQKRHNSCKLPI